MSAPRLRVAVVGSGIAGLGAAHRLASHCDVTVFEAANRLGGHAHTVDVTLPGAQGGVTHGVDTGFLVFNERTYPRLRALFAELDVEVAKSEMSFSVQAPRADGSRLEWSGTNLNTVLRLVPLHSSWLPSARGAWTENVISDFATSTPSSANRAISRG